jgi:hypothetical protein
MNRQDAKNAKMKTIEQSESGRADAAGGRFGGLASFFGQNSQNSLFSRLTKIYSVKFEMQLVWNVAILPRKVTGLPRKVTGLPRKVTGLCFFVTNLARKATGLPRNVMEFQSNVMKLQSNVTGLPRKVTGLCFFVTNLPRKMVKNRHLAGFVSQYGTIMNRQDAKNAKARKRGIMRSTNHDWCRASMLPLLAKRGEGWVRSLDFDPSP